MKTLKVQFIFAVLFAFSFKLSLAQAFGGGDAGGGMTPIPHVETPYKYNCKLTVVDYKKDGPDGSFSTSTLNFTQTNQSGYFSSKESDWDRSKASPSPFYQLAQQSLSFKAVYRDKVPKTEVYLLLQAEDPKTHMVFEATHNDSFDFSQKVIESSVSLIGFQRDASHSSYPNPDFEVQLNMTLTCTKEL